MNKMTILINGKDTDISVIEFWNPQRYHSIGNALQPLLEKTVRNRHDALVISPVYSKQVRILQRKGYANMLRPLDDDLTIKYNPNYSIFYRDIHVATIKADVGQWETGYQIKWNETFVASTGTEQNAHLFLEWVSVLQNTLSQLPTEMVSPVLSFVS